MPGRNAILLIARVRRTATMAELVSVIAHETRETRRVTGCYAYGLFVQADAL